MNRKDFFSQVGLGAASLLVPVCIGGIAGCKKENNSSPSKVDFTLDVSSGALATEGGFIITNGVLVARTLTGSFIAVSAACTHEGTSINYISSSNSFSCPNHGAKFSSNGAVTQGPANKNLTQYQTSLSGNTLRVFS